MSVLSTCQACFHRALRSGRRPRLPSAADNRRPCVKRRKLRGFSLLWWRDLWLEAVLSEGSGDPVSYKPVPQASGWAAMGSVCQWRSLGAGSQVGLGCRSAFFPIGELHPSVKKTSPHRTSVPYRRWSYLRGVGHSPSAIFVGRYPLEFLGRPEIPILACIPAS